MFCTFFPCTSYITHSAITLSILLFLPILADLFSLFFRFTVQSVTNITRGTESKGWDGRCIWHTWERRNAYSVLVGTWGGGDAGGPRPRWWIILKWTLKEQNERTWSGLIRLRMNTNDRMLWGQHRNFWYCRTQKVILAAQITMTSQAEVCAMSLATCYTDLKLFSLVRAVFPPKYLSFQDVGFHQTARRLVSEICNPRSHPITFNPCISV
jgi:hypothetical protein